jgi:hypothetical protein
MKNNSRQLETIDALRAGLHVEDVDFKETCTPGLIDRESSYWQRIVDALEENASGERATRNQLRIRRRQVLNGEYGRKDTWGVPQFVAGTAAGIALFLGAAIGWEAMWNDPAPATRTASIEWDSGAGQLAPAVQTISLEASDVENAEFTNNIDFYTWLEKQTDTVADSGGS